MTAVVIVFAALGAAVLGLVVLVAPPRPGLLVSIGRLDAPRLAPTTSIPAATWTTRQVQLGRLVNDWLAHHVRPGRSPRGPAGQRAKDLAILDRSEELLLGRQVVTGLIGGLLVPAAALALAPAGIRLPVPAVVVGIPLLGAALFWIPAISLHREAEDRRREFRHGLSAYLDLVAMSLAGGRGAPQALAETADLSASWPFRLLSDAVTTARLSGTNPWREFGNLGRRIDVPELEELVASLTLVGDRGAHVRETLSARAATLRRRALTDAEGDAAQADQSMRIAQVLLALGFLILIAYPAIAAVLAL
jgi:Flp pilus assembly protein TadB